MIVLLSQVTALAEWPVGKGKPTVAIPSPGGEGQGEGELDRGRGRQPALTVILSCAIWLLSFAASNPVKASQAESRLVKHFLKKIFFWIQFIRTILSKIPSIFGTLRNPTVTYRTLQNTPRGAGIIPYFMSKPF